MASAFASSSSPSSSSVLQFSFLQAFETYDTEIPTPRTNRLMLEGSLGSCLARMLGEGSGFLLHIKK